MKKIAIDIDDVLAANAEGFAEFSNQRWGTNLRAEDFDEDWSRVWRTDWDEAERRAVEFYASGAIGRLKHIPEAEAVLRRLARNYELVVITSRRLVAQPETQAWLDQHFAGVFSAVHFAGLWDVPDEKITLKLTKAEVLGQIGADYLVDDQLKHCLAAAESGVKAVLFGSYTWNKRTDLPARITRCESWAEVETYFAKERGK